MTRIGYILCVLLVSSEIVFAASTPRMTVDRLHEHLILVMREAEELGIQGRYDHLQPALPQLFDFERMTAVILGRHWRDAGDDVRRDAVSAFTSFSTATYADRFNGFSGERFEVQSIDSGPRGTIIVAAHLVPVDEPPIGLSYLLTEKNDQWLISDVFLQGTISESARLRSEFRSTLQSGGITLLIEKLDERTRLLLEGSS